MLACRFFGCEKVAAAALDAVLAFTPSLPNWAYNGAALGIGDFSNNAKYTPYGGWERPLTHYRSGGPRMDPCCSCMACQLSLPASRFYLGHAQSSSRARMRENSIQA